MTGEDFMELWRNNKGLRQYIVSQAKRHSKRREVQEEYIQEAWLCISCAPYGYDIDAYKAIAYKVIYSSYWQNNKDRLMQRNTGPRMSYARNPFDHNEMLINGQTPYRNTSYPDKNKITKVVLPGDNRDIN